MDAFLLAKWFVEFMGHDWTHDPDPGPLTGFFADWAQEKDLFALTGGDHALALQALLIAWAWLSERPQDFGRCAPYINGLADISLEERKLPTPIDPMDWRISLFIRKHGSR